MASSSAPHTPRRTPPRHNKPAVRWISGLGKVFARVALFRLEGTQARLVGLKGMPRPGAKLGNTVVSLLEPTPLRWVVEAASPVVGAGRGPGGETMAAALGISLPRAYAVMPLVVKGKLVALAYADNGSKPLPVGSVGELFSYCSELLEKRSERRAPAPQRVALRSTARRRGKARLRPPKLARVMREVTPADVEAPSGDAPVDEPLTAEAIDALALGIATDEEDGWQWEDEGALGESLGHEPLPRPDGLSVLVGGAPNALPEPLAEPLTTWWGPSEQLLHADTALGAVEGPANEQATAAFGAVGEGADQAAHVPPAGDLGAERAVGVADLPVQGADLPVQGTDLPAGGTDLPAEGTDLPAGGTDLPAEGTDLPAGGTDLPAGGTDLPAGGTDLPAEHIDLPAGHTDLPAHPADLPPTAPPSAAEIQPAWPQGTELMVTARGIQPAGAVAPSGRPWRGKALWLAATLLLIAGIAFALWPLSPVGPAGQQRTMEIAPHSTVKEIAAQLQAGDFIRSRFAFPILVRLMGVERDLRAGTYLLPTGVWAWTVVEELHRGQVHTRSVTIPEGLTLREVATLLEQEGLVSSTRFIKEARDPELLAQLGVHAPSAEGFLFPETYTLALGLKERDILRVMVEQFFTRLRAIPGGDNLSGEELLAKVTLASLVEREAKSPGEQGRIAGVFSNRLKKDLRLESCATVQYILGEPKARLRLSDIRIESPYNTYLNEGLPPGPIANPGAGALAAALNPEEHDYLFFVARGDGTGRHIFTRSFEAHQAAQQRMRTN